MIHKDIRSHRRGNARIATMLGALVLLATAPRFAAADIKGLSYQWTLGTPADLDPQQPAHFTDTTRIGDVGADGDTKYRALRPKVYQATWVMPAFDTDPDMYGEIKHPFFLTVHFKDIAKSPVKMMAYKGGAGFYGKGWIGVLGGSGDGQWKDETLVIPESMMRSPDGKSFELGIRDVPAKIPVSSMTLFSAAATDIPDRDKKIADAIAEQNTRRAQTIAYLKRTKFKKVPDPTPGEALPVTPAETEAGYRLFFPPNARQLYFNSEPRETEFPKTLALFSTPGQTQFVTIGIKALSNLGNVTIKLGDVQGPSDVQLSDVHIRWAQYRDFRVGSSWSTNYHLMMHQLIEADAQAVTPDRLGVAAMTFTVPDTAAAGDYHATLTVSADHGKPMSEPITLTVYPFKLERPDHATHAMFYYADAGDLDPLELLDMQSHGIDGLVSGMSPATGNKDKTGAYDHQQAILDGYSTMKKMGFQSPMICNLGMQGLLNADTEDNKQVYTRMLNATIDLADRGGFKPVMFPIDEPHAQDAIKRAKQACTWIKAIPGTQTYITSNPVAVKILGKLLDDNAWNLAYLDDKTIAISKSYDQNLMFYGPGDEIGGGDQRFRAGYYYAKIQPASSQYFAYFENAEDPMNDLDGGNRDWSDMCPSMTSPIHDPTIAWENFREGVNDYKFIYTLRTMAARATAAGHADAAQKALEVLDGVMAAVSTDGTKTGGPELAVEADTRLKNVAVAPEDKESRSGAWFDESRQKIADAIVQLQKDSK